jgi:hypothetical protein
MAPSHPEADGRLSPTKPPLLESTNVAILKQDGLVLNMPNVVNWPMHDVRLVENWGHAIAMCDIRILRR